MGFYPIIGGALFWISLIVAVILYLNYRKIYPLFYMISIALYVFTAGFAIDVFQIGRFGIMAILVISAVLFMIMGYYFSKIGNIAK
ncbi:MAG: hypothetical protein IH845_01535 [Nanoarchaeota archaeon]|nr:hypothetical protein [Nanoarchaeota archaeon]